MWGDFHYSAHRRDFYSRCSALAAAGTTLWRPGVSLWKRKYFVWASKRGHNYKSVVKLYLQHLLQHLLNIAPEQYNANIQLCVVQFLGGLFPEPGMRVAYKAVHKGCFYKVGQFQLCKDSLTLQYSQPVGKSATDDSNVSFEQCRVILVCCFSDQKWETPSQYTEGRNISVSRLRYSASHSEQASKQSESDITPVPQAGTICISNVFLEKLCRRRRSKKSHAICLAMSSVMHVHSLCLQRIAEV